MAAIRLDKYLADMQIGTRSQVKSMIKARRVFVNGHPALKADAKITIGVDLVEVDKVPVVYENFEYYMLNKPQGVVSATVDKQYKTVVDLLVDKKRKDLFPVGRLDVDTEGLLLITNDGELCHNLLSPRKHVDKCYFAIVLGEMKEDAVSLFEKGINIGTANMPEITKPAVLVIQKQLLVGQLTKDLKEKVITALEKQQSLPEDSNDQLDNKEFQKQFEACNVTMVELTIQEGKFHQVKRMFEQINTPVLYLKRLTMGILALDEQLKEGQYRLLTEDEKRKLLAEYKTE